MRYYPDIGLANAKIFTDLNKMEIGDVFYFKSSSPHLAYQGRSDHTVLPSETDALQIEKGKDYVTLVTCTPYAVNTTDCLSAVPGSHMKKPRMWMRKWTAPHDPVLYDRSDRRNCGSSYHLD